jgi:hypothetical protein
VAASGFRPFSSQSNANVFSNDGTRDDNPGIAGRCRKAEVVALFQDSGFAAIDLGDLAAGGAMQQIHHPLAGVNLIRL